MPYVSDVIKKEYTEWKSGNRIYISAATGTGKTNFILKELLPHAVRCDKRILYLVNREILKEQLLESVKEQLQYYYYQSNITIETYQALEKKMASYLYQTNWWRITDSFRSIMNYYNYDYIICDECHYFLADSNFNTNTAFSYAFVQDLCLGQKICIFLSATINEFKSFFEASISKQRDINTAIYHYRISNYRNTDPMGRPMLGTGNVREYEIPRNYDYVDISDIIIRSYDKIPELVNSKGGKWLIFVDNIEKGNKLKDVLEKGINKNEKKQVVMISSEYRQDEEGNAIVNTIKREQIQSAKVLISTSVMDNGINIKDIQLKNIIIIADTETEFIQMLGRRRKESGRVTLYLYQYDKNHFIQRSNSIKSARNVAFNYYASYSNFIKSQVSPFNNNVNIDGINQNELYYVIWMHCSILNNIFYNNIHLDDVKKVFCLVGTTLQLNLLSYQHLINLAYIYREMIGKYQNEGETAFLREQLRWLGKEESEINDILKNISDTAKEKARKEIIEAMEKIEGKPLSHDECVKFKNSISEHLKVIVGALDNSHPKWHTLNDIIKKNDHVITEPCMEYLSEAGQIPYEVEVRQKNGDRDTEYIFVKKEDSKKV